MNPNGVQKRLARMERECDVSAAPAILLCVASSVLVLMLAVSAATEERSPTQACRPLQQLTPPRGGNCSGAAPNSG